MDEIAADNLAGSIAVPQLRRLWQRAGMSGRQGAPVEAAEWAADRAVIDGLGLGLHETLAFLHSTAPSFASFERWILDRNAGTIDPARIARINAAVARALGDEAPAGGLPADFAPVFGKEDLCFWEENGYVVLRDAASQKACGDAALAIWDFLGMQPDAPESWYEGGKCEGIFVPLVHHPAFEKNRRSPRIRNAFAQLWGTDDLQLTTDRGGFNPPERPGWRFSAPGLHWDTSLVLPIPANIHGVLYLTDTPAEQGAFRCVPGFHRRIEGWLAGLPQGAEPRAQDLSADAVLIAGKAGDMVIWHAALPHGASPNHGERPRLVQYIAYHPPGLADHRPWL
jgi:hypothetical protein